MDRPLVPVLITIAKLTRALHTVHLQKIGLAHGQDDFVVALAVASPQKMADVAATLNVRPSTVSKMADRLEEAGYVKRVRSSVDARSTEVSITGDGLRKYEEIVSALQAMENDLAIERKVFKDENFDELVALSEHLRVRLRRLR